MPMTDPVAAPPVTAAPAPAPAPAKPAKAAPAAARPRRWRYTGPSGRIYTLSPVTVDHGDVMEYPALPCDDGCWEPADDDDTTRWPDNHRPEAPPPGYRPPPDEPDTAPEPGAAPTTDTPQEG